MSRLIIYTHLLLMTMIMSGCTSKHTAMQYTESKPHIHHTKTDDSLYSFFDSNITAHSPQSGIYPLHGNLDAFGAIISFIKNAKESIELQYFLFTPDNTGITITKHVLDAADRGVKVRIILDDILQGDGDEQLMALNSHPNISIKLFNPTNFRSLLRWVEMALHINTYGRRMHNKALIVDNSVAIMGGRNIEDIYFGADHENIFIDNDILAVGPLATQIANQFEIYWSSEVCIPIEKVTDRSSVSLETVRKEINAYAESFNYSDYIEAVRQSSFYQKFRAHDIELIYGKSRLYFDLPTKVTSSEEDTGTHLSEHLRPIVLGATKRLWIVSPYFMPNPTAIKAIKELREKGVDVAVLTNSLATNDAVAVYSAYAKYQKTLLRMGVRLYELSPHAYQRLFKDAHYKKGRTPRSRLHAKAMIIDDDTFIIGSANMDPRSHKLNTELVAVIQSEVIVELQKELFNNITAPENAYLLTLEPAPKQKFLITEMPTEKERVVWNGTLNNKPVKYYNDGNAGFWRRLRSNLVSYFPIEGYL